MKKALVLVVLFAVTAFGQYKGNGFDKPSVKEGIVNQNSAPLFGFLNSENFEMRHTFDMSYSTFGGNGIALGMYTNSMMYKFADNLNVQADISIVNSPYSSFGKNFQNSINGIYLTNAAINYMPWKDFSVSIQYRSFPAGTYYGGWLNDRLGFNNSFWGW